MKWAVSRGSLLWQGQDETEGRVYFLKMLLSIVDLAANVVVPAHSHPHEQAGTVISGEFEMTINGETRKLKPGDTYIIPGGVEHGARTGDTPARALDAFSPVRTDYQYWYIRAWMQEIGSHRG